MWISFRQLPDGIEDYQAWCTSTGGQACGMLAVDILWISAMAGRGIERASSLIQHWERRLEFCQLHVSSRLQPGTQTCARWTAFLTKFEMKLSALRMRRDLLIGLEEAAQLDSLPVADGLPKSVCYPAEAFSPGVAELFAAAFAESERMLASTSENNASCSDHARRTAEARPSWMRRKLQVAVIRLHSLKGRRFQRVRIAAVLGGC